MNISLPVSNTMEFIENTRISPLIDHVVIKVCWVGQVPNRNNTVITKEVATEMGKQIPGSPIVGYFDEEIQDFLGHERDISVSPDGEIKFVDITKAYGFVPTNAKVWFKWYKDGDIPHEYLCTEGFLWTTVYPESKKIITDGSNQSMELNGEKSLGFWTKDGFPNKEIFIYNEALLEKLCILGDQTEPCFEGSSILAYSYNQEDFKSLRENLYNLVEQLEKQIQEGEVKMEEEIENILEENNEEKVIEDNENNKVTEFEVIDEKKEEQKQQEKEDIKNNNSYENLMNEYNLLNEKYNNLITDYEIVLQEKNALIHNNKILQENNDELNTFKMQKEREQKQDLIGKFFMLNDEEKRDCVENIDKYSLDEIESKLSVYCFRNGINFNAKNNNEISEEQVLNTFSLNEKFVDNSVPDWVKAVRDTQKSEF